MRNLFILKYFMRLETYVHKAHAKWPAFKYQYYLFNNLRYTYNLMLLVIIHDCSPPYFTYIVWMLIVTYQIL